MTQVGKLLSPVWETSMQFLSPKFTLAKPHGCEYLGGEAADGNCFLPSAYLSAS